MTWKLCLYPDIRIVPYPDMRIVPYPTMGIATYPNMGIGHCSEMGILSYPDWLATALLLVGCTALLLGHRPAATCTEGSCTTSTL